MLFGQKMLRLQNIPLCQLGNDFFILLLALAIGFQKAGKAQSGAGCTEGIVPCRKLYGKRIIYRRAHLACHKALPDKPIEAILVFGKGILDAFGCSAHVCRTNCLVRILCFPLGFINDSFRVYKGIPIGFFDKCNGCFVCFIGNAEGVRTDIGNQTDRPLALDIHAFIQLLRNHHGFLCCHVQVLARLLLHGTCGKGGNGLFLSAACFYVRNGKILTLQAVQNFVCFRFVGKLCFCFTLAVKFRFKDLAVRILQLCAQRPVFFGDKFADFPLSVANQAQRNRLHTTAAQTLLHFFPKQVTDSIAHYAVKYTARLLCIH